jgi:serine/threonine-protein kinase
MTDEPKLLQCHSKSGTGECGWHLLSPGLLEKARSRVQLIAWIMLGTMAVGAVVDFVWVGFFVDDSVVESIDATWIYSTVFVMAMTVGLLVASYSSRITHVAVLHLALLYEVIACLFMATFVTWIMYEISGQFPYITWVTPLIIMFPLIVPSPPRATLVTALFAAATQPLGLFLIERVTSTNVDGSTMFISSVSPAFAVAIAYFSSRVVHGMNVDLAKAQRMGSYELQSRLGSGGMGEVWLAKHKLLARPAAVKLISPETLYKNTEMQRVALARFEREAQTTAAMRSPHTIQLYDFGIAHSGAFYYVMEYLEGLDLEELVKDYGPVPPNRLVFLLSQVCDSLGEAHERGLIHRDVKPANIYVCRYGRCDDFVKVLDFGLVKTDGDQDDEVAITADGTVSGTPAFAAPEQVLGEKVDGRTDIYSLGCTAYWALTGTYVFRGKSAMATVMMHVNTTPSPPSSCGIQEIPTELDNIVMACLEKDPANRPQTADELADMLANCDLGDAWTRRTARDWWETNVPPAERTI